MKTLQMITAGVVLLIAPHISAEEKVYRGIDSLADGKYREAVHVDLADEEFPHEAIGAVAYATKLRTLVLAGPRFHDSHLEWLAGIESLGTLRTLVLDSTDISHEAIVNLRKDRPQLIIYRSQRWAIAATQAVSRMIHVATRESKDHPELCKLIGDRYFEEATSVDYSDVNDVDNSPVKAVLNEELMPLKYLTTLRRLNLTATRINDAGMHYLKGLTNLEHLILPLDEVTADGLVHLQGMTRLKTLFAAFEDDGLKHIAGLKRLEFLGAGNNGLRDARLESLAGLTNLKSLSLSSPHLQGTGLRHLNRLKSLETLYLGGGLRELTHLPKLSSLRHLHISGTKVDDASMVPLAQCRKLETLWLKDVAIGNKGVSHLKDLPNLRDLNLSGTQVGDAGLADLAHLPQLRYLHLSDTKVTNTGLNTLKKFPHLKHLTLYNMTLNEKGIQNLESLTKLESLYVSYKHDSFGDDVSRRQEANRALTERLKKALPNCRVQ